MLPRIAIVVLLLAAPSPPAAATPALTKRKAETYVKRVLSTGEYGGVSRLSRTCARRTAWKRVCKVDVRFGYTRYRGTMTVLRTGIPTSPVDTFTMLLRGVATDADDIDLHGRFIVETRRAMISQPLRLWVDDADQLDVTVGWPSAVVPPNEYDAPPAGSQWLAFPVEVWNTGKGRFDTSFYEARLVLRDGTVRQRTRVTGCEPDVDLAGGEYRRACIGFEIPVGATWDQVEWRAGNETGIWTDAAP